MRLILLVLCAAAAWCGESQPVFDGKAMMGFAVAMANGGNDNAKAFSEQFNALQQLAEAERYDEATADAVVTGVNALRLLVSQRSHASEMKRLLGEVMAAPSAHDCYGVFTTIVSDEAKAENVLRLADDNYYANYVLAVFVPTVGALVKPVDLRKDPAGLPVLTVYQNDGESDADYRARVDANARKAKMIADASRIPMYQPIILDFFKSWLANAHFDKPKLAQIQAAFERTAGKGTWVTLVAPPEAKPKP